jgi:dipeptidyl aminopeptidase/acylaminoacyl peptidase
VRNPELYRGVVSLAGPSDLVRFMDDRRGGGADNLYYQYWVGTVGDPKADLATLKTFSPALRAAEIKAPVLLIHGLDDSNVLPNQSRIMAEALRAARKPVEHLEVRGVGHSYWEDEDERLLVEKSVAFLAKVLA